MKSNSLWSDIDKELFRESSRELFAKVEQAILSNSKDFCYPRTNPILLFVLFIFSVILYFLASAVKDLSDFERFFCEIIAYTGMFVFIAFYIFEKFFSASLYKKIIKKNTSRHFKDPDFDLILFNGSQRIEYKHVTIDFKNFIDTLEFKSFKAFIFKYSFFRIIPLPFVVIIPISESDKFESLL